MLDISKRNAEQLGLQTLLWQTQEECGELIKAIAKFNRTRGFGQTTEVCEEKAYAKMLLEIADVSICIEQLIYLLDEELVIEHFRNSAFEKVAKRYGGSE